MKLCLALPLCCVLFMMLAGCHSPSATGVRTRTETHNGSTFEHTETPLKSIDSRDGTYDVSHVFTRPGGGMGSTALVFQDEDAAHRFAIRTSTEPPVLQSDDDGNGLIFATGYRISCQGLVESKHNDMVRFQWEDACTDFAITLIDDALQTYIQEGRSRFEEHLVRPTVDMPEQISSYEIGSITYRHVDMHARYLQYWECEVNVLFQPSNGDAIEHRVCVRGFEFDGRPGETNQVWIDNGRIPPLPTCVTENAL